MKERFIITGWFDRKPFCDAYDEKTQQTFCYSIAKNIKPQANSLSLDLLLCDSYSYDKVLKKDHMVTKIESFRSLQELTNYALSRLKTHITCGKRLFFYDGVIADAVKMCLMQDLKYSKYID